MTDAQLNLESYLDHWRAWLCWDWERDGRPGRWVLRSADSGWVLAALNLAGNTAREERGGWAVYMRNEADVVMDGTDARPRDIALAGALLVRLASMGPRYELMHDSSALSLTVGALGPAGFVVIGVEPRGDGSWVAFRKNHDTVGSYDATAHATLAEALSVVARVALEDAVRSGCITEGPAAVVTSEPEVDDAEIDTEQLDRTRAALAPFED